MPLHSVKNLVGEAALTRVAPLANAAHCSIVQPFQNGLFVDDTIFTDQIIDLEKLVWITDVSDMRVFA